MKTAIFLGAGASAADGAPLQKDLFRDFFELIKKDNNLSSLGLVSELRTFFYQMFYVDIDSPRLSEIQFPTFEEAIGILDLAETRNEYLKDFTLDNIAVNSDRIRRVKQYLILSMAVIIDKKLRTFNGNHELLVKNLIDNNLIADTLFVSSNYDILIDNSIHYNSRLCLDYSLDFKNNLTFADNTQIKVKLFKIHGSLNWLFCPTCNTLYLIPGSKLVDKIIDSPDELTCLYCGQLRIQIVVPPSFFKNMNNYYLASIWNKTELALREVEHIIFCGYSFPDADIHIKYLIKRIQTNRHNHLKISVFNHYNGKSEDSCKEEKERYKRFLGNAVKYENVSFQNFANNPVNYLQ